MCGSVTIAQNSSTINDISDNHMRQRNFVQKHNESFGINELNWRKKLSSSNYQHYIDKNQSLLRVQARRITSTNWINIRRIKAIRANRHLQPIPSKHSNSQHTTLTNLDVHFEWNSRIYFSISPEIYSR